MRLTLNLDSELYVVVRSHAGAEDCSIGTAVSKLLRRGLEPSPAPRPSPRPAARRRKPDVDLLPVTKGERPFTSGDVYRIEETFA